MALPAVLIVEDDDDLRGFFRTALALAGFTVTDVANGLDALRSIDAAPPDVIVLDLHLPLVEGTDVLQEIQGTAHTRHIPVVVVTGSTADLSYLDVNCVLRKPVSPEELVLAVQRCAPEWLGPPAHSG